MLVDYELNKGTELLERQGDRRMIITICDDDKAILDDLEAKVSKFFRSKNIDIQIKCFNNGESFLKYLEKSYTDIAFIDIVLNDNESGVRLGRALRDVYKHHSTVLIYISSYDHYTRELVNTKPFEYIKKPIIYADLSIILSSILDSRRISSDVIDIKVGREIYKIKYDDILYIESDERYCRIHTSRGVLKKFSKVTYWDKHIKSPFFMRIHQSYLVNFNRVDIYSRDYVILENGDKVGISPGNRKAIRENYTKLYSGCN